MNKNILLGLAAFGGLLLVGVLLKDTPREQGVDSVPQELEETRVQLPANVSVQIPVHPYIEVQNVRESSKDGIEYATFSVVAEATKAEVNEWYRESLSQNGWSITSDKNVAGYQIIQAKNESLSTSVQAASGVESGTVVISQQAQFRP